MAAGPSVNDSGQKPTQRLIKKALHRYGLPCHSSNSDPAVGTTCSVRRRSSAGSRLAQIAPPEEFVVTARGKHHVEALAVLEDLDNNPAQWFIRIMYLGALRAGPWDQ